MNKLEQYIQDEWVDYPVSKIDASDGMDFVEWMGKNQGAEFLAFMASENIVQSQLELSCALMFKDTECANDCKDELMAVIGVEGRELLKESIEEFENSYCEEEENRLEGYSFDSQRMM